MRQLKMAESLNSLKRKSISSTESNDEHQSSEQATTKRSTKKSKRKSQSSSECESPNKKTKIGRENNTPNTPNGDANPDESRIPTPWTFEEEHLLFEKVDGYLKDKESTEDSSKPFYLKSIEWNKIEPCGEHTPQEAHVRFTRISTRVRKMRTAKEILEDMKLYHTKSQTTPSRKRKVKVVDPDLPKKPVTSYFQYLKAKRQKLVTKHPELSVLEITQKLSKRWMKLSDEKKQKYSDSYTKGMEEYNIQILEYLKKHNPDVEPPLSAHDLWTAEEKKSIKSDRPDISDKKLGKKLKSRWENIEEEDRIKWDQLEKKELSKFKKRIVSSQKKAKLKSV